MTILENLEATGHIDKTMKARNVSIRNRQIKGVVLHDTAGSGTVNDAKYLANPGDGRNVSVDFVILRDGRIYQLNPNLKDRCTYHAGRSTQFKGESNGAVNQVTIGIELAQKADLNHWARVGETIWPTLQVKSAAYLCAALAERFNLAEADITTHAKIIRDGSRSDPRKFPFTDFWHYYREAVMNSQQRPIPGASLPNLDNRVFHTVVAGDTLWAIANKYGTTIEKIKARNNMETPDNTIQVGQKLLIKD